MANWIGSAASAYTSLVGISAWVPMGEVFDFIQVDRNLALYLPRLVVLVSIEADRPGA
jgi:fructose-specific phosphotransferase system IIC component